MKDTLVKAIASNQKIRIVTCTSTQLCETARLQHNLWPTSAAALGRVLTMTAMMGRMEKEDSNKVTVTINGGGPIGTIMAEGWGNGDVRGFVGDPEQFLQYNESKKLAVGLVVGTDGYLKVTRDLGLKDRFTGQTELQTGEIAEDFAYYYTVSEQTPSAVSLGVLVDEENKVIAAGGILIQIMPDATEVDIQAAEKAIAKLRPVSTMVKEGLSAEELVKFCFEDAEILETQTIQWHCNCNRDRFFGALSTIKYEDLEEMIAEDHGCTVKCEFCNTEYKFSEDELKTIIAFKKSCGK